MLETDAWGFVMFKGWLLPYNILNMIAILVSRTLCILSCVMFPILYVEVQNSTVVENMLY
jgi:hypothetical protein